MRASIIIDNSLGLVNTENEWLDEIVNSLGPCDEVVIATLKNANSRSSTGMRPKPVLPSSRARVILLDNADGYGSPLSKATTLAQGDYIIMLDPSVTLKGPWVERLVAHLNNHAVGAVCPFIGCNGDDSLIGEPDLIYVDSLNQRCLAIRRDALERIGGLDDNLFFLYLHAQDLSVRLPAAGYRLAEVRDVTAHIRDTNHLNIPSSPLQNARLRYLALQGANIVAIKSRRASCITSIIILCHNQLPYTMQCIDSVFRNTPGSIELIVVDNASSDGTREYLKGLAAEHPNVKIILNESNVGFAAGVNQGLRIAGGDYIVLLNNDVIVPQGWLARLLAAMNVLDNIGLVGPVSNFVSGPQLVSDPAYDLRNLQEYADSHFRRHAGELVQVPRLVGFCLLIKRAVVERIGGFDIRFGIGNFEDDDYCMRAGIAGFSAVVARDTFVHHYGSVTFRASNVHYEQLLTENGRHFALKWGIRFDPESRSYDAGSILAQKYEPLHHYVPMVTEWTPQALLAEAHRLVDASRFTEAHATFHQVLGIDPDNIEAMINLAYLAVASGDYAAALSWWTRLPSSEVGPYAERLNLIGVCHFNLGHVDKAIESFRKALEVDPEYSDARSNLSIALARTNANARA